jgi:hypothetical protein
MQTTMDLDSETERELKQTVSLTREKQAVVLRLAVRAGLPVVASRFQAPRPEGHFADCYPEADERRSLKRAMAGVPQQRRRAR